MRRTLYVVLVALGLSLVSAPLAGKTTRAATQAVDAWVTIGAIKPSVGCSVDVIVEIRSSSGALDGADVALALSIDGDGSVISSDRGTSNSSGVSYLTFDTSDGWNGAKTWLEIMVNGSYLGGRTVWIENGVLKNLAYSRFWAQKQGKQPVVSAGPLGPAQTWNLKMAGGTKSLDDLVAGTARGILVTHFFYIRVLEPRTVLLTGLTRDGTFLVEDGKISRPIKNLRWNESPLFMLNKVEDLGRPERTSAGVVVPAIKARDFTFTSISDAV